ncbi:MAG: methyltransferase domain-containing protein [Gammaproteobacteria bacterium]|nr:methyltransferase domain-containing protein [Gammaproteobacteria bacterium]
MAVIWQKKIGGSLYQIRSAGKTRRLYTNGVCHSEFNPAKLVTGSIWDLLILLAFFYQPESVRRILMLGVGGGASILQLHHLLDVENICGVELDPVHLELANRFFNIETIPVDLHNAEAREWLQHYKGSSFDLIIDDLFTNKGKEPVRALEADTDWFTLLLTNLSETGRLVINFASTEEFRKSAYFQDLTIARQFSAAFRLSNVQLDNIVGAFVRLDTDAARLRANVMSNPVLAQALHSKKLRYNIRNVSIVS